MDFWKGMTCAQALIFVAYLLYGCFVYVSYVYHWLVSSVTDAQKAFQGQFTLPLAYQGVAKYGWQTLGNMLSLLSGIIAAGLYGNIGISEDIGATYVYSFLMSLLQRLCTSTLLKTGSTALD